jgi:hypothetical protein
MTKEMSKRQMIDEILKKARSNKKDLLFRYELQIMSRAFVEHFYKWYVLDEKVEQYDLR